MGTFPALRESRRVSRFCDCGRVALDTLTRNMPLTWLNWFSNCITDVFAWLIAVSGYITSCSYLAVLCSYWLMVLSGAAIYVLINDCILESAAMMAAVSMPNWPFARVGRMA